MAGCRGKYVDIGSFRLTPITPFTYRDGLTYLQVLEQLRKRDCEIIDHINSGLEDAAEALDKAISDLLKDLEGPIARIDKLETDLVLWESATRDDLEEAFAIFREQVLQLINDALKRKLPDVFSYHVGKTINLQDNIAWDDNHYADHGLSAADYSRKGWTAEEIDNIGWSVERLAYEGDFAGERHNPRRMVSDHTGSYVSYRAQMAALVEPLMTGSGTTDVTCDTLTDEASHLPQRRVA